MTEAAWTTRWSALVNRYPTDSQLSSSAEDAQNLSNLIQVLARDGLDLPALATEYLSFIEKLFLEEPILKALVDQVAYNGMIIPVIIAYLCDKLQVKIAGDDQIKKYNGIGGINKKKPVPFKSVTQYKKTVLEDETPRPLNILNKYEDHFSTTKAIMNKLLSQYLLPKDTEADEVDAEGLGSLFEEQRPSSEDSDDSGNDPGPGSRRERYKGILHHPQGNDLVGLPQSRSIPRHDLTLLPRELIGL